LEYQSDTAAVSFERRRWDTIPNKAVRCAGDEYKGDLGHDDTAAGCMAAVLSDTTHTDINYAVFRGDTTKRCYICRLKGDQTTWKYEDDASASSFQQFVKPAAPTPSFPTPIFPTPGMPTPQGPTPSFPTPSPPGPSPAGNKSKKSNAGSIAGGILVPLLLMGVAVGGFMYYKKNGGPTFGGANQKFISSSAYSATGTAEFSTMSTAPAAGSASL
jgi:hypothetical protein